MEIGIGPGYRVCHSDSVVRGLLTRTGSAASSVPAGGPALRLPTVFDKKGFQTIA